MSTSGNQRDDDNGCSSACDAADAAAKEAAIAEAQAQIAEALAKIAEAKAKIAKAEADIELLDKALAMLESAIQELREAMQTLMDLVHEIDSAFASNIRGATGAIVAFTNKMLSIMNSFDAKTSLSAANVTGINVNFNPLTGQGHDRNAVAQAARWAAMNEAGNQYLWRQALLAQNPNHQPLRTEQLNRIVVGNQVPRDSAFFRDATINTFYANRGQCTWFAEGRAQELTNIAPAWSDLRPRNAANWASRDYLSNGRLSNIPSQGAIMVWGPGGIYGAAGHVAVVERIVHNSDGFSVLYSHANTGGRNSGTTENSASDGRIDTYTRTQLSEQSERNAGQGQFLGFVHLR